MTDLWRAGGHDYVAIVIHALEHGLFCDLLLVAAHPIELAGFSTALGSDHGTARELEGLRVATGAVGVGLTVAGSGTALLVQAQRPRCVLLVGSFGRYPGRGAFEPGELCVPDQVLALDQAVLEKRAAFPSPMPSRVTTDRELSQALRASDSAVRAGTIATTLAITTDDALANAIGASGDCDGENLEAIAVGLACAALQVRFSAVLGCSNQVGANGRREWAEHHALVARTTSVLVLEWLARGAPGFS